MAGLSWDAYGILLMLINGTINTIMASSGKLLRQADYQYFHMMAISDCLVVLCCIAGSVATQSPLPGMRQSVWLFFRGFFGSSSLLLLIMAVRTGASPGDAAALGSVNTVIAALLGRIFLGEKLGPAHSIAIACAVAGAVLISKPSFLFDVGPANNHAWLGFLLAGAAGFMKACVFIAARKCMKVSQWHLNLSPAALCTVAFIFLPVMPFVDEPPSMRFSEPLCILFILLLFVFHALAMYSQSAASKLCRAAVGATSNTGAAMVSGYIVQTLLFDKAPDLISICGGALMFASVIIMAATRVPGRQQASDQPADGGDAESHAWANVCNTPGADDEEDDTESLGSFIAAQYVEQASDKRTLRMRHPAAVTPSPSVQTVGAMMSVVPSTAS